MRITSRHIGNYGNKASSIIELTVELNDSSMTESITNFKTNKVDEDFIESLRQLADEFEEHNYLVDNN